MVTDEEFETELGMPDLIAQYRDGVRKIEHSLRKDFTEHRDELRKLKIAALENERLHRDLLNLCAYPFTENGRGSRELGFRFLRGSPLHEKNLPNFDLLIARLLPPDQPACVILIEGKASVGNPRQVANEVEDKKKVAIDAMGTMMTTYLGQPAGRAYSMETVIAVDSIDANNMMNAVVESGFEHKVWHGPTSGPETLSIAAPPKGTPNHHRFLHSSKPLNDLLNRLPSVRRAFDVWPKTHPLIQLGALISASHPAHTGVQLTSHALDAILSKDMFYLTPEERAALSRTLVELGQAIGFLTPLEATGEYRAVAKGVRRDSLEQSLQEKWLRWQLERDFEREQERHKETLRATIRTQRAKYKTILDY